MISWSRQRITDDSIRDALDELRKRLISHLFQVYRHRNSDQPHVWIALAFFTPSGVYQIYSDAKGKLLLTYAGFPQRLSRAIIMIPKGLRRMYETAEDRLYDPDSRLAFQKSERSENLALVRQQKDLIYNQQARHSSVFVSPVFCSRLFFFATFHSTLWLF